VINLTPEAKTQEEAFQSDVPEEVVEIEMSDLEDVRERLSTSWKFEPQNIAVGCPQLSMDEVKEVLNKLKGKRIVQKANFWICTNEVVKNEILNSELKSILLESGAKLTSFCPTLTPLQRPFMSNSAKACYYTSVTYKDIDECIIKATEGGNND
jgi:predicted aconitase